MDIEDCFNNRLLKKVEIDKEKIKGSVKISEKKLLRSKELFNSEFYEESLLSAYTSMFHAARALLYSEWVQEKSHFVIYIYLREKFSDKLSISLIEAFRNFQLERHEIIYGFDGDVEADKTEEIINDAEEFYYEVKELIKKNGFL